MPRLAVRNASENSESSILRRYGKEIPHYMGLCEDRCASCGALHWMGKRSAKTKRHEAHSYSMCCGGGQVTIPATYQRREEVPEFIRFLLTSDQPSASSSLLRPMTIILTFTVVAVHFRKFIRAYNNACSFTSLGADVDHTVDGPYGSDTFKVSGQLSHHMGSILPPDDGHLGFAQHYMFGGPAEQEIENRILASRTTLNPNIIRVFMEFMYKYNPYARQFKTAGQLIQSNTAVSIRIKTANATFQDPITNLFFQDLEAYNNPTSDQVMVIIPGGGDVGGNSKDVILHTHDGHFTRIDDLNTSYWPMRYVWVWPFGAQGYDMHYVAKNSTSKFFDTAFKLKPNTDL